MKINLFGDLWGNENGLSLSSALTGGDLSLFNLETPVYPGANENDVIKSGVKLKTTHENLTCIRQLFPKNVFASLANNHIADYGQNGIKATISACKDLKIYYSGISSDNDIQPLNLSIKRNDISIFSVAEPQFGISQRNLLGVNYISPNLFSRISECKKQNRFIIVSVHGGTEMLPWPYPAWQELCRNMVSFGANVVHGHHPHVPQGFEEYKNGLILYGMGNFVIPVQKINGLSNMDWSLFASLDVKHNKLLKYDIFPIKNKNGNIDICEHHDYSSYLKMANNPLNDPELLEAIWQSFSVKMHESNYKEWLNVQPSESDFHPLFYHMFNCPTHSEAIKTYFGIKCGQIKDVRSKISEKLVEKHFKTL